MRGDFDSEDDGDDGDDVTNEVDDAAAAAAAEADLFVGEPRSGAAAVDEAKAEAEAGARDDLFMMNVARMPPSNSLFLCTCAL